MTGQTQATVTYKLPKEAMALLKSSCTPEGRKIYQASMDVVLNDDPQAFYDFLDQLGETGRLQLSNCIGNDRNLLLHRLCASPVTSSIEMIQIMINFGMTHAFEIPNGDGMFPVLIAADNRKLDILREIAPFNMQKNHIQINGRKKNISTLLAEYQRLDSIAEASEIGYNVFDLDGNGENFLNIMKDLDSEEIRRIQSEYVVNDLIETLAPGQLVAENPRRRIAI